MGQPIWPADMAGRLGTREGDEAPVGRDRRGDATAIGLLAA
jgi:hypothetical protein